MNVSCLVTQKARHQYYLILTIIMCGSSAVLAQSTSPDSADLSSPDQVMLKKDMEEILKRPEFRHLTREREINQDSELDLKDWVKEPSSRPSPTSTAISGFAGTAIMAIAYLSVIAACILVLYLIYQAASGFKFSSKFKEKTDSANLQGELITEETVSPAEHAASTYLEQARQLASEGDYHKAIVQLLYGSMSYIERSGWIRFRKGLTYRDYIRAARQHGLPGESLRQMIRTYEPLGFGRREATREHFESTLQHYESAFQKKA